MHRGVWIAVAAMAVVCAGCASRAQVAERTAARMLDPRTPSREMLCLQGRLIGLAPESAPFLASGFFPIGLYDAPESALFDIAAAGFNLVLNGDTAPGYLDRARAAGLRVVPYVRTDERMPADVREAAGERAVFAWYLFDEPDLNGMEPETYAELSAKLRRLDRSRGIFLTVLRPKNYPLYVGGSDILAPNPYPIRRLRAEENNLREVIYAVRAARLAAGARPVWVVLQAFWAEPVWPRNPTPEELRCMAFLALNHGASGVTYFSWKSGDRTLIEHRELFESIRRLNGQLDALRGALLVPPEERAFEIDVDEPAESARRRPVRPPERPILLDCSMRAFGRARLFIAANPDPWPKRATIGLPGLADPRVSELFPGASPAPVLEGDRLTLAFEPFEVRLLWLAPPAPR